MYNRPALLLDRVLQPKTLYIRRETHSRDDSKMIDYTRIVDQTGKKQQELLKFYLTKTISHREGTLMEHRRKWIQDYQIRRVAVPYHGSGDSGEIDGNAAIFQTLANDELVIHPKENEIRKNHFPDRILDIFCQYLDASRPGWENNEGTEGEISWNLERNTITVTGSTPYYEDDEDEYDEDEEDEDRYEHPTPEQHEDDSFQRDFLLDLPDPETDVVQVGIQSYLDLFSNLEKHQLRPETLKIIKTLSNMQSRFAKLLLSLPEIQQETAKYPTLEKEILLLAHRPNQMVPMAWDTPNQRIHACWNLFLPQLADFWSRGQSKNIPIYRLKRTIIRDRPEKFINGRSATHVTLPALQSSQYAQAMILLSLIESPIANWKRLEKKSLERVVKFITDEIHLRGPVLQESMKSLCKSVIKSLGITKETTQRPNLGVMENAILQDKLREQAKDSIQAKRLLEACQGSSAILSLLLDDEDSPVQTDHPHQSNIQYLYYPSYFSHENLYEKEPDQIRKILSQESSTDPELKLHRLIFGARNCKNNSKTKRRRVLQAIPEFRDRWLGANVEYWNSQSPRELFSAPVHRARAEAVHRSISTHFGSGRRKWEILECSVDAYETFEHLLKLPNEYLPKDLGEMIEYWTLFTQCRRHLTAELDNKEYPCYLNLAEFWKEYLRSHRQGKPRWQTMDHLFADIEEAGQLLKYLSSACMDLAQIKNPDLLESKLSRRKIRRISENVVSPNQVRNLKKFVKYLQDKMLSISPANLQRLRERYSHHVPILQMVDRNLALISMQHAQGFFQTVEQAGGFRQELMPQFEEVKNLEREEIAWPRALLQEVKVDRTKLKVRELCNQSELIYNGQVLKHCIASYVRACIVQNNSRILEMYKTNDSGGIEPYATALIEEKYGYAFELAQCRMKSNAICPPKIERGFEKAVSAMEKYWKGRSNQLRQQSIEREKARAKYMLMNPGESGKRNEHLSLVQRKYGACQKWWILSMILPDLPEAPLDMTGIQE